MTRVYTRFPLLRDPRPYVFRVADLPVADVATALHRPVGTVKRRLSEARVQLALDLREES